MKKKNLATAMAAAMAVSAVAPVVAHADGTAAELKANTVTEVNKSVKTLNELQKALNADTTATEKDVISGLGLNDVAEAKNYNEVANTIQSIQEAITKINGAKNVDTIRANCKVDEKVKEINVANLNTLKDAADAKQREEEAAAAAQLAKEQEEKASKVEEVAKDADRAVEIAKSITNFNGPAQTYVQQLSAAGDNAAKAGIYDQAIAKIAEAKKAIIKADKVKRTANVALANGLKVTPKAYKDVHATNGTLETKDDKLSLNDGEEVIYANGKITEKLSDATTAEYFVSSKMNKKELETNKDAIKDEKEKLGLLNDDLKNKLNKTVNGEKVYKIDEELSKEFTGMIVDDADHNTKKIAKVIVLVNEKSDKNKEDKYVTFVLKNEKIDNELINENDKVASLPKFETVLTNEKLNNDKIDAIKNVIDGTDVKLENNVVTVDFADKAPVASLSRILEVVDTAYAGKDVEIKETEAYVDGHLNKTITYTEKGKKEALGQIVIKGYENFKKNYESKVVRLASMKDLGSLELPELSWSKVDVMNALYKGQLKGYEDNTIKLNKTVTRAEFAQMIAGIMPEDKLAKKDEFKNNKFTDVNKGAWYFDAVDKLAKAGIVEGDGNGTFRPEDGITRQEVAVILAKVIKGERVDKFNKETGEMIDTTTTFLDDDQIAAWADASVAGLKKANVTTGYKVKENIFKFAPEKDITRAEAIVMITKSATANAANIDVE